MAAEGTGTVIVVVAESAEAFCCECFVPALEGVCRHDFAAIVIVIHKVGHVHNAHVRDIAGKTACIGENGNVHALKGLVDHILFSTKLAGRIDGDLYMAVGVFKDLVCSGFHACIDHRSIRLSGGEFEFIGLVCAGSGTECKYHAESENHRKDFFHGFSSYKMLRDCGPHRIDNIILIA